ncbi:antiviral reverse transcriptase Drt3b [Curvivirga sp.]|uniref:antiviral reverse transcriptase Drt3b n=1 Tax=Curvivirga sp. TaxID=2856848 RepID=UPI003B5AA648
MPKQYISKTDYDRVILTELLPYEMPFHFTNHFFYQYIKNKNNAGIVESWKSSNDFTIPMEFTIPKGVSDGRLMSVIHPISQLRFIDFYKDFDQLIIHQCSKSPYSIRAPRKIADCYYIKDAEEIKQEEDGGVNEPDTSSPDASTLDTEDEDKVARTYFTYGDFAMLHKFYAHDSFQRLEKKYPYYKRVDVSKCFYSIYTHSIAWAVTSKEFAKSQIEVRPDNFETKFDQLMQRSNYNETNGILVGPEVSRIFSEIIFQRIDLSIFQSIKNLIKNDGRELQHKVDYDIKRYMDDFFIFGRDLKDIERISEIISSEIRKYNFYLNESKDIHQTRPFMTNISVAKVNLKKCFEEYLPRENISDLIVGKRFKSKKLINEIKGIIKQNDTYFSYVNNFVLNEIHSRHKAVLEAIKIKSSEYSAEELEDFLERFIDVISFLMCMSTSFRSVHRSADILVNIFSELKKKSSSDTEISKRQTLSHISKYIFDEMNIVLDNYSDNEHYTSEKMSILIMIKHLCQDNLLSEEKLSSLISLRSDDTENLHMKFTTALIYTANSDKKCNDKYEDLVNEILLYTEAALEKNIIKLRSADHFIIFCDYMSCPFLDFERKWEVFEKLRDKFNASEKSKFDDMLKNLFKYNHRKMNAFKKALQSPKTWPRFTNWNIERDIRNEIRKKELPLPY